MIIAMTRVRVLGPVDELRSTVTALQDLGLLHLTEVTRRDGVRPREPSPAELVRERRLRRVLDDVESVLDAVSASTGPGVAAAIVGEGPVALLANRLRGRLAAISTRRQRLVEERQALEVYRPLFDEFDSLLSSESVARRFAAYVVLVPEAAAGRVDRLEHALEGVVGAGYELRARALPSGELVLLLLVPLGRAALLERELATAEVDPVPVPEAFRGHALIEVLPRLRARLDEVSRELEALDAEVGTIGRDHGATLMRAQQRFRDELVELEAERVAGETSRAFVLEGWVPEKKFQELSSGLERALHGLVAVRSVGHEQWQGAEAPVALSNPRLFSPFERVTALLPLPRYGTFDPTPFVAVFFPMLFGVVVGDVGYGSLMAVVALLLRRGAAAGSVRRDVSKIAGAVALCTMIFGGLYGEFFGDLGRTAFGMQPVWLHREEAVVPFLILALAIGVGHLALGMALSALSQRRSDPRAAIGRGLALLMLALIVVALLVVFDRLPGAIFTPAIVALLIAFPILVAVEGLSGMFEFLTLFGHVLSYARVMAVGTASVMLAVVANRMAGAFGSAAIGIVFALLFHLVNFAITLFSPTIHVLRLHYVEFFSTFYSPGGATYRPLAHWTPAEAGS